MSGSWTEKEIAAFLQFGFGWTAREIAELLGRTKPAVMGMRRKLKRLRELDAKPGELPLLLTVSNAFVETHTLRQIRFHAELEHVPVRPFVRRSRYRKPHLVGAHKRNRSTP